MRANVKPAVKASGALVLLAAALGALFLAAGRVGRPASNVRKGASREASGKKGKPDGAPAKSGKTDAVVFSRGELDVADELYKSAARGDADLVRRARDWAGDDVARRIWVCDIVCNAGRVDALAVLARDALDACRGGSATYGRLFRTAKFLEECHDWKSAREALDLAAPLAKYRTHSEDVAFARARRNHVGGAPANCGSCEQVGRRPRKSTAFFEEFNGLRSHHKFQKYVQGNFTNNNE